MFITAQGEEPQRKIIPDHTLILDNLTIEEYNKKQARKIAGNLKNLKNGK